MTQIIQFEPVIIFKPNIVEKASYNIVFTLVGINGINGFSSWKSSFQVELDKQNKPLTKEFPLVGSGQYGARGSPLISSFLANLQIEISYPSNAPLPTRETSNNKWKGTVTLTSGSLIGSLSAEGCRQVPSLYNIKGTYSLKVINGTFTINVKNVTIL